LRVVLDTNVLFSALGFPKSSPPSKILDLARGGKLDVILSPFILDELEANLQDNLHWESEALARLRRKLKMLCGMVHPRTRLRVVKRKDSDNRILECALESRASVLITGDLRDLRPLNHFQTIEILTPREFLLKYFPQA
jgi:putative PIN family toxin of toxin-antitoxin system